ncbi:hypothetical protein KV100_12725 [Mumia sp. zg.B21]|uniref:hypothetical protein n=1 Tax=Mumia sp. zg.B21 TaxID=2855447 RepID=UPI001C6EA688|nr:hypothetical protein [Mumia sp. zg.B21]MBW9210518.1 hypothetical protein [Mumia sp. zg.B21]
MNTYGAIVQALPLTIRGIEVTDPVLTLFGDDWSLTLMCPWTVEGPGVSSSWESENLEDEVWDLVGREITSLTAGPDVIDPTFHLSGDIDLAVRADSDLDPWTLMIPGLVVTGRQGL